jgi:hypothetical protein
VYLITVALAVITALSCGHDVGYRKGYTAGRTDCELEAERMANITTSYMNTERPLPLPPSVVQFTVDSSSTDSNTELSYINSPESSLSYYSSGVEFQNVTIE